MTIMKILLAGAFIAVMLVVAKDQQWFGRAGVVGRCSLVGAPWGHDPGGAWYRCREGIMTGYPMLEGDSCDSVGFVARDEVWHCVVPLASVPGT